MISNYKKGFSLAEMLIVFLLISIMLAAFAPVMTKKAKKKVDPNCPSGTKDITAEYTIPGPYTFTTPKNVVGGAVITLVGPGAKGSDGTAADGGRGALGGLGGEYKQEIINKLEGDYSYSVFVGAGGGKDEYFGDTVFDSFSAQAGNGEADTRVGGGMRAVTENGIKIYGTGGAPGSVCKDASCNPHGKQGNGYSENAVSDFGFIAGTGGGGGGYDAATDTPGYGGFGGDGYVRIEYTINCTVEN